MTKALDGRVELLDLETIEVDAVSLPSVAQEGLIGTPTR